MTLVFTIKVECDNCGMECHFPDDSKMIEDCPWCNEPTMTGWSDDEDVIEILMKRGRG